MRKIISVTMTLLLLSFMLTGCYPKQEEIGKITLPVGGSSGRVIGFFEDETVNIETQQFIGESYYSPDIESLVCFDTEDGLYGVLTDWNTIQLYRLNKDNPADKMKLIAERGSIEHTTSSDNMATDGEKLYFVASYTGKNSILSFDLTDGEFATLYTLPGDEFMPSIVSIKDGIMIIASKNINMAPVPTAFFAVSLETGESQMVKRIPSMLTVGSMAGCVYDDALYILDVEKDALVKFDFFTGEETVISDNLPLEDGQAHPRCSAGGVNDGKFQFEYIYSIMESDGENIKENVFTTYIADLNTGEITVK